MALVWESICQSLVEYFITAEHRLCEAAEAAKPFNDDRIVWWEDFKSTH